MITSGSYNYYGNYNHMKRIRIKLIHSDNPIDEAMARSRDIQRKKITINCSSMAEAVEDSEVKLLLSRGWKITSISA